MADSFRIISGDGKPPEISKKSIDTTIIEKINRMEAATAYVAVQGVMVPILYQLQKKFFYLSRNTSDLESPIHLSIPKSEKSSFIESSKSIDKIKSDLQDIQIRMKELEKNAKKILELRIDSTSKDTKITAKDLWTYPNDDKFWNDPESHGGIFGRFFALKGVLEKRLASLQKELIVLKKNIPKSPLVKTLEETIKYLLQNIPKTSSKWNKKDWTNATGFLDLVQDKKKITSYLENVDKSLKSINKFTNTKDFHVLKLKNLDTQSAYVYLITIFLPFLQNQAASSLDKQGNTMKLVSKVFDLWNKMQDEITKVARNSKELHQWIKEGKVDSNYNLYKDKEYKERETDPDKLEKWNPFKFLLSNLATKRNDLQKLLDTIRNSLPYSTKSLVDTMKTLTTKMLEIPIDKEARDLSSFLKVLEKSWEEVKISEEIDGLNKENNMFLKTKKELEDSRNVIKNMIPGFYWNMSDWLLEKSHELYYNLKVRWNKEGKQIEEIDKKINTNNEKLSNKRNELSQKEKERVAQPDKRLTLLSWMINSDQTQFKNYMDILGQGVTALTSISNMTQQMLQIDTQYYNSLLGLQKIGQDTLNKIIQSIMNNMR